MAGFILKNSAIAFLAMNCEFDTRCLHTFILLPALTICLSVAFMVAAQGTFITDDCTTDADCASGCCGFNSGKCAGAIVAQGRDGGCGFGDAQPNDNAAQALQGQ